MQDFYLKTPAGDLLLPIGDSSAAPSPVEEDPATHPQQAVAFESSAPREVETIASGPEAGRCRDVHRQVEVLAEVDAVSQDQRV
jgi:hypothetical protein